MSSGYIPERLLRAVRQRAGSVCDPKRGLVVPLFNPRVDNWSDHFAWSTTWRVVARPPRLVLDTLVNPRRRQRLRHGGRRA
jgi:hypothetical protein